MMKISYVREVTLTDGQVDRILDTFRLQTLGAFHDNEVHEAEEGEKVRDLIVAVSGRTGNL